MLTRLTIIRMDYIETYMPALKWQACTGFYGFLCAVSRLGAGFKGQILDIVRLKGTERVADVGCGTGTMLRVISRTYPHVRAYGIDPDLFLLTRARKKLVAAKDRVMLEQGVAQHIAQPDQSFDIVFCTLTLHHLPDKDKKLALNEMFRILKPGGRVVITDFYRKGWQKGWFFFENYNYLRSCLEGKIPSFLEEAGFEAVSFFGLNRRFLSMAIGHKPHHARGY
jgi:ubiquinone/menaquinone biosynthesis C-methylase UbiE